MRLAILDIETTGFSHPRRVTCGVCKYFPEHMVEVYGPGEEETLCLALSSASVVAGHNVVGFDIPELSRAVPRSWWFQSKPVFDLLAEIRRVTTTAGWSQSSISSAMLGTRFPLRPTQIGFSGDMPSANQSRVLSHCIHDVLTFTEILREMFRRGGAVSNGRETVTVDMSLLSPWRMELMK